MGDPVFLDTSALYAVLDGDDTAHRAAASVWRDLVASDASLVTSNLVLVELTALLQGRLGVAAVDALTTFVLPWVSVAWVDERVHEQAVASLLGAGRQDVSLVDHASFVLMRKLGIRTAFTIDTHFFEQGFGMMPQAQAVYA